MQHQLNRRLRRSLLQNPKAQIGMGLWVVNYLLVYMFIVLSVAVLPGAVAPLWFPELANAETAAALSFLLHRVWPISWVVMIVCVMHAIWHSHRIFGPLTNVRHVCQKVGKGDLTARIRFRKGDLMGSLDDDLNAMIGRLQIQTRGVQDAQRDCSTHAAALQADLAAGKAPAVARLAELESSLAVLGERLAAFRTASNEAVDDVSEAGDRELEGAA